ncbi:MAG: RdgB/HAM1 family non-canonical purine NTP pyrophosphatase [Alphaproteobacteria bacterium]|nr:RdgB/HAM1 family non-canonical purine NTP pyrophosphatase [Alphaproteobacteria bacterium]
MGAGQKLVIASHNSGKVVEIRALLEPFPVQVVGAAELGLPEPEETGETFAENASIKAEAAARQSGEIALADDSGLCVAALDGQPGIYSARWAGPDRDFLAAMTRVEHELKSKAAKDSRAWFVCALALAASGQTTEIFDGRVFGSLTFPPRGSRGFGYDPIFVPEGYRQTFGEMNPDKKHAISHRAKAFVKLVRAAFVRDETT